MRRLIKGWHTTDKLQKLISAKEIPLSAEMEKVLRANQKAWVNFNKLAPGYRKQYVAWVQSGKKQETRKKRLQEAVRLIEANQKLGMK